MVRSFKPSKACVLLCGEGIYNFADWEDVTQSDWSLDVGLDKLEEGEYI